ncbi:serpin family protein [Solwaraspora sp. WMMD1047]|uniref:serpin family protein n=1 Tax=Solwaraspora sp. WMMD1047 TaxID=3016102 RepID=UPI0024159DF9|nr:serpin family protein [Solwaraspora sp. WMMD1047]MDG4830197.1 serpin family protein [Solwaraspora sp. WMMD1047]
MSVAAANGLTARWAAALDDAQTVLSGAGAYPLLALLARHAAGPARAELLAVAADGTPFDLADSPTTRLAVGVWSRHDLPLTERWRADVPADMRGALTGDPAVDQPILDRWAAEHTDGLVPTMPIAVNRGTLLVLASALTVLTTWAEPFSEGWYQPGAGPWRGRRVTGLHRRTSDLTALRVADTPAAGPVTLLTVAGDQDVDVVLTLGRPELGPARLLPAAIGALAGTGTPPGERAPAEPTEEPTAGPGVTEQLVPARDDRPELAVSTVAFTVDGDHDLLRQAALFGLATATSDTAGSHFPGISPVPLVVSQARQRATATFGPLGFRAAAVTAIAARAGAAPPAATTRKRLVRVDFDRPFGFLAVHRPTGLVLVAGWVSDPN